MVKLIKKKTFFKNDDPFVMNYVTSSATFFRNVNGTYKWFFEGYFEPTVDFDESKIPGVWLGINEDATSTTTRWNTTFELDYNFVEPQKYKKQSIPITQINKTSIQNRYNNYSSTFSSVLDCWLPFLMNYDEILLSSSLERWPPDSPYHTLFGDPMLRFLSDTGVDQYDERNGRSWCVYDDASDHPQRRWFRTLTSDFLIWSSYDKLRIDSTATDILGNVFAIGKHYYDFHKGGVWVWEYNSISEQWIERRLPSPPDLDNYQSFGSDVAISPDGNTIAVAAHRTYEFKNELTSDAYKSETLRYPLKLEPQGITRNVGVRGLVWGMQTRLTGFRESRWDDGRLYTSNIDDPRIDNTPNGKFLFEEQTPLNGAMLRTPEWDEQYYEFQGDYDWPDRLTYNTNNTLKADWRYGSAYRYTSDGGKYILDPFQSRFFELYPDKWAELWGDQPVPEFTTIRNYWFSTESQKTQKVFIYKKTYDGGFENPVWTLEQTLEFSKLEDIRTGLSARTGDNYTQPSGGLALATGSNGKTFYFSFDNKLHINFVSIDTSYDNFSFPESFGSFGVPNFTPWFYREASYSFVPITKEYVLSGSQYEYERDLSETTAKEIIDNEKTYSTSKISTNAEYNTEFFTSAYINYIYKEEEKTKFIHQQSASSGIIVNLEYVKALPSFEGPGFALIKDREIQQSEIQNSIGKDNITIITETDRLSFYDVNIPDYDGGINYPGFDLPVKKELERWQGFREGAGNPYTGNLFNINLGAAPVQQAYIDSSTFRASINAMWDIWPLTPSTLEELRNGGFGAWRPPFNMFYDYWYIGYTSNYGAPSHYGTWWTSWDWLGPSVANFIIPDSALYDSRSYWYGGTDPSELFGLEPAAVGTQAYSVFYPYIFTKTVHGDWRNYNFISELDGADPFMFMVDPVRSSAYNNNVFGVATNNTGVTLHHVVPISLSQYIPGIEGPREIIGENYPTWARPDHHSGIDPATLPTVYMPGGRVFHHRTDYDYEENQISNEEWVNEIANDLKWRWSTTFLNGNNYTSYRFTEENGEVIALFDKVIRDLIEGNEVYYELRPWEPPETIICDKSTQKQPLYSMIKQKHAIYKKKLII